MPSKPCLTCGELVRAGSYCARHTPAKRPSPSSSSRPSPHIRKRIKQRDGQRCRRCGTTGTAKNPLEVHHRQTVGDDGSHDDSNLVTLCRDCHHATHRRL